MATRATYSFEQEFNKQGIVVYSHLDNYPEGAAVYFWNMHKHLHYKGGLVDAFIKANPMSIELTENHERHDDTEYRYFMDQDGFLQVQKIGGLFPGKDFQIFFSGHYAEFINQYDKYLLGNKKGFERLHLLSDEAKKLVSCPYLTLTELKTKASEFYALMLEGYRFYRLYLSILEGEYQRLKSLNKKI